MNFRMICSLAGILLFAQGALSGESELFKKAFIHRQMKLAAEWQMAHEETSRKLGKLKERKYLDWVYGPYVNGLVAAGKASGDQEFISMAEHIGEMTGWGVLSKKHTRWMANNHATLQSWYELYEIHPAPEKIAPGSKALDEYIRMNEDADDDLRFERSNGWKWCWCDALYMSPPTFALAARVTGDSRYLDFLHRWWWKASAYYYSPEHRLYFRDHTFFGKEAPNGKPVFWCRGNGWVVGGLVRVLSHLDQEDPQRSRYEMELVAMLTRLRELQSKNNLWNPNLLDPDSPNQPDSSGSGLILYAFAYALNEGLLPKEEFLPVVEKAWPSLCAFLDEDGRFAGVQPIGDSPGTFNAGAVAPYGTGAFLLAASEVYRLGGHDPVPDRHCVRE